MVKRPNTYKDVKKLHKMVDWDNTFMYRVRGVNPYTHRDVWVTTKWQRTLEEAKWSKRYTTNWKNLRIIKMSIGKYMQEKQNIPHFC